MSDPKRDYFVEMAGALAPDLEGAAHSRAHPLRMKAQNQAQAKRGDSPSATSNLPSAPKKR